MIATDGRLAGRRRQVGVAGWAGSVPRGGDDGGAQVMEEGHVTVVMEDDEDLVALEERARPFRALYEHWERTQWAVHTLDFSTDRASFAALDPEQQQGLIWIFAHRFHAEFSVATLLAPFLAAAPDYDMQLLLATQTADEYRHLQCVLRIYEEVFGIGGGIPAVRAVADRITDPVASRFYEEFDRIVRVLEHDRSPDAFLRAILAYHLIAEGVVARTAQHLASDKYARLGNFPGLAKGQRLVARDEARHIGIGVAYARRCLTEEPARARAVIDAGLEEFGRITTEGLLIANEAGLGAIVQEGYGVDAATFYGELLRFLNVRLRSIGYLND